MRLSALILAAAVLVGLPATPALAQRGPWGGPGHYGEAGAGDLAEWAASRNRRAPPSQREGQVTSAHFMADGAETQLGAGPITLVSLPGSSPTSDELLMYEAALIDRLVLAGYDTMAAAPGSGQIAEIRVWQDVAEPAEQRRSPVSGAGSVTVGTHGSSVGMAVAVDFTDPLGALLVTHMELQIQDQTSGAVLWEARAQIYTRDGDEAWDADRLASRLSAALFEDFPVGGG